MSPSIWPLFQTVLGVSTLVLPCFLIMLTVFVSNSPLSKSPLSAFLVTSSPDEASLTSQPRRFVTFISPHPPHRLIRSFTAIEHHKRQLLHSLSTLLQSRLLPFPRSATILMHRLDRLLTFLSRKVARTMDHPHLLPACHRRVIRSSLAPR